MITSSRIKTLHSEITQVHALDEQIHQLIRRQLESAVLEAYPEARSWLREVEPRLYSHASALGECLERLEASPSSIKQALGTVIGGAAAWIEAMRSQEEVSRMLRDDYAALSLALVQTAMLETVASALGDRQTAALARQHLDQLREALTQLEEVLTSVLDRELRAEGKAMPVAGEPGLQ
jgi:ferritin-like metal-binding protein YciE